MKPLKDLKQELKNLVPLGIDIVLKTLKQYLPSSSLKFNSLIKLEARYRENHKKIQLGTIGMEDSNMESNRIREAILELIDELEEKDFQEGTPVVSKSGHRKGKILYRIPDIMQIAEATTCLVRIAFDEETLTYDITVTTGDEVRELRRVSEVMGVELIDPSADKPFKISTFSETVQFVDEDDYTEWSFFVTPLKEGEFPLLLKVSVIELKHGKERKRDIVMEEQVKIITTVPSEKKNTVIFKEAEEKLQTGQFVDLDKTKSPAPYKEGKSKKDEGVVPPTEIKFSDVLMDRAVDPDLIIQPAPSVGGISSSGPPKRRGGKTGIIYMLAFLILASTSWAIPGVREEVRWVNASYLKNDKEALLSYQKRYPTSRRKQIVEKRIENFEWEEVTRAVSETKEKELIDYREKYPETKGRFFKEASIQLADIEYKRLPRDAASEEIINVIKKYPNTPAAAQATERLAKREYKATIKELDAPKLEELTKKYPALKKSKAFKKRLENSRKVLDNSERRRQ